MKRYNPIPLSWLLIFLTSCTFSPVTGITTPTEEINTPTVRSSNTPTARYHIVGVNDGGFLSLDPCGPPCFYGILPGITTETEAEVIISQNEIFGHCVTFDLTMYGGGRSLFCDNGIVFSYDQNLIGSVGFSPSVKITFQQVIDLYGPPDLIDAMVVSLPDVPLRSQMSLYYDEFHMAIRPAEQDGTEIVIDPITIVETIIYLSEDQYQELKTLVEATGGMPWIGFGTYTATLP